MRSHAQMCGGLNVLSQSFWLIYLLHTFTSTSPNLANFRTHTPLLTIFSYIPIVPYIVPLFFISLPLLLRLPLLYSTFTSILLLYLFHSSMPKYASTNSLALTTTSAPRFVFSRALLQDRGIVRIEHSYRLRVCLMLPKQVS